ncbi:MAG TPA: hypothetical protein VHE10_03135 [Candidatus Paceibacterota bacterium]|nr:hypothetical protein [Candidatus Paceibacterota bacterium]
MLFTYVLVAVWIAAYFGILIADLVGLAVYAFENPDCKKVSAAVTLVIGALLVASLGYVSIRIALFFGSYVWWKELLASLTVFAISWKASCKIYKNMDFFITHVDYDLIQGKKRRSRPPTFV